MSTATAITIKSDKKRNRMGIPSPNENAHLPGPLGELQISKSLHAGRVRCSGSFGWDVPRRSDDTLMVVRLTTMLKHEGPEPLEVPEPDRRGCLPQPAQRGLLAVPLLPLGQVREQPEQ